MKILFVTSYLSPETGGPHKNISEFCRALALQANEVTLYTLSGASGRPRLDGLTAHSMAIDGVDIHYFPVFPGIWGLSWPLWQAIRTNVANFDIVHILSIYQFHTFIASYFCNKYRVPYIIEPHGTLDPFMRRNKSRFKKAIYTLLIEKRNLDYAAAIRYATQEEKDLAHRPINIRAPGVVVPLGLYPDKYAVLPLRGTLRARFSEIGNKFLILFLGRINFKKGLDLLARAYAKVAREYENIHLVISGPDTEGYGRQVRKYLKEEGVLDRVTFTGMLLEQEKLAAFADADVFVLPSYSENFGNVVLEAMVCGVPVIISNKVNIWREVTKAQAGLIINCDAYELTEALRKVIYNYEDLKKLGANGKKLVEEKFTWDRVAKQMIEIYNNILKRTL